MKMITTENEYPVEILLNKKETANLWLFQTERPAAYSFIPGQYIKASLADSTFTTFLTIASHPDEAKLEFLINSNGKNAHEICSLAPGKHFKITSPLGNGFPVEKLNSKTIYLVSHGSGISAMKPLIMELRKNRNLYGPIRFIYGVRHYNDFPYKDLLQDWMGSLELYDIISRDPGNPALWNGESGHVQDVIKKIKPEPQNAVAVISGSEAMEKDVAEIFKGFGFSAEQILKNH